MSLIAVIVDIPLRVAQQITARVTEWSVAGSTTRTP
jgi:hypothetical protein